MDRGPAAAYWRIQERKHHVAKPTGNTARGLVCVFAGYGHATTQDGTSRLESLGLRRGWRSSDLPTKPRHIPGKGLVFLEYFFTDTCVTKKLELESAPPGHQTPSSAWWRDAALERKSTSGASATGPVS